MKETCESCRFWERHGGDSGCMKSTDFGDCRHRSPVMPTETAVYDAGSTVWPEVTGMHWCGDFEQKTKDSFDKWKAVAFHLAQALVEECEARTYTTSVIEEIRDALQYVGDCPQEAHDFVEETESASK